MGGYQLIDFKKTAFTSGTEATVIGPYDAIANTTKRTVVTGLVVGTTEYPDFEALFTLSGTTYIATATISSSSTITFAVAVDDGITVTVS